MNSTYLVSDGCGRLAEGKADSRKGWQKERLTEGTHVANEVVKLTEDGRVRDELSLGVAGRGQRGEGTVCRHGARLAGHGLGLC